MLNRFKDFIGKNIPTSLPKKFRAPRTGNSFTLKNTDFGKINVECDLIRRFVERAAEEIEGIHGIGAVIEPPVEKNPLVVRFSFALEQNYSVQDVSGKLVTAVKKVLEDFFQIIDVEIYVKVTDVAPAPEKKSGRRVR